MYNMGRQSEHIRNAKASMFTKSQDVTEAKKAFLVPWCPHGTRKGAKKNILLATKGQKKQGTSKAEMERHLAERPKPIFQTTDDTMRATSNRKNRGIIVTALCGRPTTVNSK